MANNSGSHRTASSSSSRYSSGNSRRTESYSERYNRPNPYTGYLPPGVSAPEEIYHPESVDPVRVRQLEREHEQARLRAHEEKADFPDSAETSRGQSSAQRQQRTQVTRSQVIRGSQDAPRRGRQTRRAQVAQQQAARAAGASHRAAVVFGDGAHLDEIRQNAIDEAEKLRSRREDTVSAPLETEVTEPAEKPKKDITAGLPVAGAAQFAAMNMKADSGNETEKALEVEAAEIDEVDVVNVAVEAEGEEHSDEVEVQPEIAEGVEIIIAEPTAEEYVEKAEDSDEPTEAEPERKLTGEASEEIEKTELTEEAEPEIVIVEEAAEIGEETDEEVNAEVNEAPSEETEDDSEEAVFEIPEEAAESEPVQEEPDEAEPEQEKTAEPENEDFVEPEIEQTEPEIEAEAENEAENDDDIKVYAAPEKESEVIDEADDFDADYYEYEDEVEEAAEETTEETEDIATDIPTAAAPRPRRRRSFETRISPELADSSMYSPGVAQDETLFIRKKRPEDATAVFAATTPGIAPELDDDDFFEQWLEEGDDMIIKDKRQRRRASAIIGGATMIFAIIGFIFVIVWFIKGIPGGSSSSGTQTDYASFILPVVNADPEPFETISSVDNNVLVEAAINRLTYGEAAADHSYTALEVENETRLLIPSADVEESGRALFSEEFAVDYANMYTIEDEKIYYYSAADDSFHVITTSGDIEPEIIKISHIGSRTQVLLEVGYLSTTDETADDSEYYKKMEYVLNAVDGGYYVSAVRAIEE